MESNSTLKASLSLNSEYDRILYKSEQRKKLRNPLYLLYNDYVDNTPLMQIFAKDILFCGYAFQEIYCDNYLVSDGIDYDKLNNILLYEYGLRIDTSSYFASHRLVRLMQYVEKNISAESREAVLIREKKEKQFRQELKQMFINSCDGRPPITYTFADPSSSTILASVEVELYQTGGSGAILDKQTIVVADDGQTGEKGDGAYTIILGNSHESIACDSSGVVKTQTVVNIPFTCYKGTQRAAATITTSNITGIPTGSGITPAVSSNASASGSGLITLTFPATNLNNSSGSEITLTFTITENSQTVPMKFSWNKTLAGQVGNDAVILQVFAPAGDIIENKNNTVTLSTQLTEGANIVSNGITYQWYQYNSSSSASDKYDAISGQTSSTLTVQPNWVNGYGSFKCVATYKGNPYRAYGAVRDKSDPLQVEVFSSLGQQLVNGAGYGAVYARIYLNGEEVDQIQTTDFVTSTSLATGTKCYLLDTTNKLCTYKVKSGNSWITGTEGYTGTYTWTFRDKDGETISYNGSNSYTGKVLYIDGSLIDTKIIFDVEVSYGAS